MLKISALYHGHGWAIPAAGAAPVIRRREALLLVACALAVRLVLLPHATLDTGDTASRIWLGWRWADDPFPITNGLWGPLHFYLIGALLRFWQEPVWAPLLLHAALGSLVPVVVCQLALELFGGRRAALAAGLMFALYPAAIAVSLGARAETPFMLFLGLGLVGLARAWRPDGRLSHALFAGLAVTLAAMLRYEAWLLLPFLTLLLVRRPKQAAVFLAAAMIHPVIWMAGSFVEFGNPLYSLLASSTWLHDVTAHEPDTRLLPGLGRVLRLAGRTAAEMTLPVALLVLAGAILCVRQRRIEFAWLVLPLALFTQFAVSAFRDTMTIKQGYTTTFGLLTIPFAACALESLGVERWDRSRCLAGVAALIVAMGAFMWPPVIERLPGGSKIGANPVPSMPDAASVRRLQELIQKAGLRPGQDALISDFFGLQTTPYVAWQTRLHPERICRAPGAANWHVTAEELRDFLRANHAGVLITRPSGRLTAHLSLEPDRGGALAGVPLRLEPVGSFDWESDEPARRFGRLTVSRYEVTGPEDVVPRDPRACSRSCPLTLCRHPASLP